MKTKYLKWQFATLLILIGLLLAACGPAANSQSAEQPESDSHTESDSGEPSDAEEEESSSAEASDAVTTASGLQYIEIEEGTGPQAQAGDFVRVHYTGTLEDGTEFDSSLTRGQPFPFTLGQGEVIAGWDEGIALMKEGGKAQLIIPPELGYGASGGGPIPPNATLIFDVELVEVISADAESAPAELEYIEIEAGTGPMPQPGDFVSVHYTGTLEDGTQFDSSEGGDPITFPIGQGRVIPGWDQGIAMMNEGGKAQLIIPPELGYGPSGNATIPPNSTLIFDVELVSVTAPPSPTEVSEDEYTETESGLRIFILEEGNGTAPQPGDALSFNYRIWSEDGTLLASSIEENQPPVEFAVGDGTLPPGMEEGVLLMEVGGTAQMEVPAELGFGEFVILEVELLNPDE